MSGRDGYTNGYDNARVRAKTTAKIQPTIAIRGRDGPGQQSAMLDTNRSCGHVVG